MLIKWIKLENIRSYTTSKITFPEGTTLLSGDIGSGKSTILLAIEFVLFGLVKGEISGSTLLRKGTVQGDVELCFQLDDKEIIIKRILKKKKDSISQDNSYIIINGVKKESAPVELKASILELLGYPMDFLTKKNLLFRYTVYTPQEEMKRIIFESKEDRLNTLRKVFGVDKYKRIRENVVLVQKRLKEQCKEISGYISDFDLKKNEMNEILKTIEVLGNELIPLEKSKKESNEYLNQLYTKINSKKKIKEEFMIYKNKIEKLDYELSMILKEREENNNIIKEYEKQIMLMNIVKVDESKKDELEKNIKEKEEIIVKLKEEKSRINEKEKNLTNMKKDIEDYLNNQNNSEIIKTKQEIVAKINQLKSDALKKEQLMKDLENAKEEKSSYERNKAVLNDKILSSKETLNKITGLEECPTCLQKVDDNHKHKISQKQQESISNYTEGINMIDNKIKSLKIIEIENQLNEVIKNEKELNILNVKVATIEGIEKNIIEKKEQLQNIIRQLEQVIIEKNKIEQENIDDLVQIVNNDKLQLQKINDEINKLKIKKEKEDNIERLIAKNNEHKLKVIKINEEKNNLAKESDKFKGIDEIVANIESKIKNKEQELKNIEININIKQTKLSEKNKEITKLKSEIDNKETKRKEMIKKKQYIDWIDNSFIQIIAMIEKNILVSVNNEFNALFQEWFDILVEDELITARLDEEFTPIVQQNGYDIEAENLSGGEKTALALAYRLALNKVINEITSEVNTKDLLILDEPTDGFSEQQLDKIRDVLDRLQMKQLIIVSHENKIESFVDNIINITKNEHISQVG
ncbi:MAG: AAA family ATPase [Candidatus Woesearchaeota archaeon]